MDNPLDSSTNPAIRTYFNKLGLDDAIADIYLSLYNHGPQIISQLARTSNVERTRIYRLIDQLMESNLVELESGRGNRGIIKAAPITNIRILIDQRQEALRNLQDELELVEQALARNTLSNPTMRIQTYTGEPGLQIVLGNILSAANAKTPPELYDNCLDDMEKKLSDAQGDAWIIKFNEFTTAGHIIRRRITQQLPVRYAIYNNVVAYFDWQNNETFYGTEIYNQSVADTQRRLLTQS